MSPNNRIECTFSNLEVRQLTASLPKMTDAKCTQKIRNELRQLKVIECIRISVYPKVQYRVSKYI